VLLRRHFDEWGERYLGSDPESRTRSPAAVKVPSGAFQDIFDAWAGELAYDPRLVRAPVAIIRGEWDAYCTDADALWLFDALKRSPEKRDIKIGRAAGAGGESKARRAGLFPGRPVRRRFRRAAAQAVCRLRPRHSRGEDRGGVRLRGGCSVSARRGS
jgi:hypothetical protein